MAQYGVEKEAVYRALLRRPGCSRCRACASGWSGQGERLAASAGEHGAAENIDVRLMALGFADAFGAIVSAEEVRHGKPDPEVFLLAAERLGVGRKGVP